jgi:S1-C subfamily serine protease
MNSMASGFVIKVNKKGSYGITAAHFCDTEVPPLTPTIKYKNFFLATSLNGDEYKATVLESDIDNDICLIYIEGLVDVPVIKVSAIAPKAGDKVYNIGAPRGIWQPYMVPMFEGIYNGDSGKYAFYSLPANPGSSGSMILNHKGELVGVLHSVYIRFPHIILSSRYEKLTEFIRTNIKKYETYRVVMNLLGLKDVFAPPEPTESAEPTENPAE